jgi:hypothetical protein
MVVWTAMKLRFPISRADGVLSMISASHTLRQRRLSVKSVRVICTQSSEMSHGEIPELMLNLLMPMDFRNGSLQELQFIVNPDAHICDM